jgi:hypothetical protein
METFSYNIGIPAKAKPEADEKMKALAVLSTKLTAKELAKLAHIVVHDPAKAAMAKTYLGV